MRNSISTIIVAGSLLLFSGAAVADGWGDLGGTTKNGDYIGVTPCAHDPLGCSDPPPENGFAVFIRKKNSKDAGGYYKRQLCTFATNGTGKRTQLICTEGDSPLAGVTYKIIPNKNQKDCSYEYKYICVNGCNKTNVPRVLLKSYWECD